MYKRSLLFCVIIAIIQLIVLTTAGASTVVEEGIYESTTWTLSGSPYLIDEFIDIEAALTIEPGVVVKFGDSAGMNILGTLNARGNAEKMITFTDNRDDMAGGDSNGDGSASSPAAGRWNSITIADSGAAVFEYCDIKYGGKPEDQGNIYKTGTGDLTLNNCTISNSLNSGIYIYWSEGNELISDCVINNNGKYGVYSTYVECDLYTGSGNTFSNNAKGPVCIDYGYLDYAYKLSNEGSPYYITGGFDVIEGGSLNIDPGVVIKFDQEGQINVNGGTLNAKGTPENSIYFTEYRDDEAGGDTNGDGDNTLPMAGYWPGIIVNGGYATLDYCVVRYGGKGYSSANISREGEGQLVLTNCVISDSLKDGLYVYWGTALDKITGNKFRDNYGAGLNLRDVDSGYPIYKNQIFFNKIGIIATGAPLIGGSEVNANMIFQNEQYGVNSEYGDSVNATYNWWGDPSGPYHAVTNPDANGDAVNDGVDYGNYLTVNPLAAGNTVRLAGAGREETAFKIAKELYPNGVNNAIVVEYLKFADAMSATLLAKAYDAPIFPIGNWDTSINEVINYLKQLNVKNVYIVGGEAAIKLDTENKIKAANMATQRIFGADRDFTSVEVIKAAMSKVPIGKTLYVVNGLVEGDQGKAAPGYALIPSADVCNSYNPVLLIDYWRGNLEANVIKVLDALDQTGYSGIQKIIILGNATEVNNTVAQCLQTRYNVVPQRVDGTDEYAVAASYPTAVSIAGLNSVILTRGEVYADALAGGSLAGRKNAAIMFVKSGDSIPDAVKNAIQSMVVKGSKGYILGGTDVVISSVENELFNIIFAASE